MLIGGEPGVGKSTLGLQAALGVAASQPESAVLYASGEESMQQVAARAQRVSQSPPQNLLAAPASSLDGLLAMIEQRRPALVVLDSAQTITGSNGAAGSVSGVREVSQALLELAKTSQTSVIAMAHLTKDGAIAGPRLLEHACDVVLYFDHDQGNSQHRLLRCLKNRFGATQEVGIFEITDTGMRSVDDPSSLILQAASTPRAGSALVSTMMGSRAIVAEVQALLVGGRPDAPRRHYVTGMAMQRVMTLAAVLRAHTKLSLASHDIITTVAGGGRLEEVGTDASVVAAMISSHAKHPMRPGTVCFGEIGLTGQVQPVVCLCDSWCRSGECMVRSSERARPPG